MSSILAVENLHVHFFTREGIVKVLNGISFSLEEGQILGLLGESGAGKTVLTNAIANAIRRPGKVVEGSVFFLGENMFQKSEAELQRLRGKDIALITANPKSSLNPLLTIGDQMANVYRAHSSATKREAFDVVTEALRGVGINDPQRRAQAYPHELSGGMAKRVVIATALMHSPKLLIADEPTFGLDVTIQRQILDLMEDLLTQKKMTVLMVTRDLSIAANYCQEVGVLYKGEIVEYRDVEEFFETPKHPYSARLIDAVHI